MRQYATKRGIPSLRFAGPSRITEKFRIRRALLVADSLFSGRSLAIGAVPHRYSSQLQFRSRADTTGFRLDGAPTVGLESRSA